jgi:hypothetical protein
VILSAVAVYQLFAHENITCFSTPYYYIHAKKFCQGISLFFSQFPAPIPLKHAWQGSICLNNSKKQQNPHTQKMLWEETFYVPSQSIMIILPL